MEKYHQIIPEQALDKLKSIPRALGRLVTRTFLNPYPLNPQSSYEHPLDEPLDIVDNWPEPTEVPKGRTSGLPIIERPEAGQLRFGWDSEGTYISEEDK